MSKSNQHINFHRSNHTTRRAFSNLLKFFNPRNNFVFTWHEILAGLSILSFLSLVAYLTVHFAFWPHTQRTSFQCGTSQVISFTDLIFSCGGVIRSILCRSSAAWMPFRRQLLPLSASWLKTPIFNSCSIFQQSILPATKKLKSYSFMTS